MTWRDNNSRQDGAACSLMIMISANELISEHVQHAIVQKNSQAQMYAAKQWQQDYKQILTNQHHNSN